MILATLPAKSRGQIFVEVASESDIEMLDAPTRFAICWLIRDRGQQLQAGRCRAAKPFIQRGAEPGVGRDLAGTAGDDPGAGIGAQTDRERRIDQPRRMAAQRGRAAVRLVVRPGREGEADCAQHVDGLADHFAGIQLHALGDLLRLALLADERLASVVHDRQDRHDDEDGRCQPRQDAPHHARAPARAHRGIRGSGSLQIGKVGHAQGGGTRGRHVRISAGRASGALPHAAFCPDADISRQAAFYVGDPTNPSSSRLPADAARRYRGSTFTSEGKRCLRTRDKVIVGMATILA